MINFNNANLIPVTEDLNGELSDKIYCKCNFCEKMMYLSKMNKKMSGKDTFCSFCLRNHFYTACNKNILILSFRGIIGYYYDVLYKERKISISEIKDCIEEHQSDGLNNPVFYYDQSTYLWFVDFNRIGKGRRKISLNDVLKTITLMLACFNIHHYLVNVKLHKLYEKFEDAILKFHSNRYRPIDKRILIPTVSGCSFDVSKTVDMEEIRNFLPEFLKIK